MKSARTVLVLVVAAVLAGCGRKEVSKADREQAASLLTEADFAVTIREWARAETLYTKALQLTPDTGDGWLSLAVVRMRVGNKDGARSAYKQAIAAYKDDYKANPSHAQSILRQAYILVILGRADDARALVDNAHAKNPADRALKAFVDGKGIDAMVADPGLKSLAP